MRRPAPGRRMLSTQRLARCWQMPTGEQPPLLRLTGRLSLLQYCTLYSTTRGVSGVTCGLDPFNLNLNNPYILGENWTCWQRRCSATRRWVTKIICSFLVHHFMVLNNYFRFWWYQSDHWPQKAPARQVRFILFFSTPVCGRREC